jgi:hypothetical protein
MALPKDVSGQLVLRELISDGKALLDRASDAGWPELNGFSERFHRYIRVFDNLLPEEASKIKTFIFFKFLDYDSSDEDLDGLSKHPHGGWQNETEDRRSFRDFDFGQIQIAVSWLLVLAEKLRLLPLGSSTSEPKLSQEIPIAKAITEREAASAHLVPGTNTTGGRKRGPKADPDGAAAVAEIVVRVAPEGDWRSKLDDICEALDKAQIPFPARWWKRDHSCNGWADYDERANAVKGIEYRLKLARQQKKTTPETLS